MKRILLSIALLCAACGAARATNVACSAAALNDPSVQSGSPPGCTQVDMQFSMFEPVVLKMFDDADSSTQPSDASVAYNSAGGAGGEGANSQRLIFFQIGRSAFSGTDIDNFTIAEEWSYTFTLGVTDIGGSEITGAYLALNNLSLFNTASITNISEHICPGTTTFSAGCAGEVIIADNVEGSFSQDVALGPTLTAGFQFQIDISLNQPNDGFGLPDFEMGFDEVTPEPATFALMATALAAIGLIYTRRHRTN